MIEQKISNYQKESHLKFKNALTPKQYRNKRRARIVFDIMRELVAAGSMSYNDKKSLITKIVSRNSEKVVRDAVKWTLTQPGKNKVALLVYRLQNQRTAATSETKPSQS